MAENKYGVHPIIIQNKGKCFYWFNKKGNFVSVFQGIDGKVYSAESEPKDWPEHIWDLYEKDGITVEEPTDVEEIFYPDRSRDQKQ